jgi:hypothetical protein
MPDIFVDFLCDAYYELALEYTYTGLGSLSSVSFKTESGEECSVSTFRRVGWAHAVAVSLFFHHGSPTILPLIAPPSSFRSILAY